MTNEHRDLWWDGPTATLGQTVQLTLPEPFRTDHGGELPAIQVSYETWGTLAEGRDNVVLIIHPMTTDCHVTGTYQDQAPGWWEELVGPGRAIDTDRWFVVCPNLIGGCYGTTGPRFPAPDGEPYLERFPLLTPRDMMRAQRLFLLELGLERVQMLIGPSMGGMIAWEWAALAPEMVGTAVIVAAPLVTTPHQIALNWLQRKGLELDLEDGQLVSRNGHTVARGVGMLSYRSPPGLQEKFGRSWFKQPGATLAEQGLFNVESWLRFHGKRIARRFDPITYMLFSRAMDLHDLGAGRESLDAALARMTCRVLALGISSDCLYPAPEVRDGVERLTRLGRTATYAEIDSLHGHDAFLLEIEQVSRILRDHPW